MRELPPKSEKSTSALRHPKPGSLKPKTLTVHSSASKNSKQSLHHHDQNTFDGAHFKVLDQDEMSADKRKTMSPLRYNQTLINNNPSPAQTTLHNNLHNLHMDKEVYFRDQMRKQS
jgi:hypothetical protein